MKVKVFLVCYNESELLPHTVQHYKRMMPSCEIVVNDNFSTDNSRELATSLGCAVVDYDSGNIIDDIKLRHLKNNCWKGSDCDWVVVCDMDEWLCVDEQALEEQTSMGCSIIGTIGYDIVEDSKERNISDINIQNCSKGIRNKWLDKKICFSPKKIKEINYEVGAHGCSPVGNIKSDGLYLLKHMNWLGLPYRLARNRIRFERSEKMRSMGMATHYTNNEAMLSSHFKHLLKEATELKGHCTCFLEDDDERGLTSGRPASPLPPAVS